MKFIKKAAATILLSFGFVFLLLTLNGIVGKDVKDREGQIWGGLMLGIPPTALGIWLIRNLQRQHQQEQSDRLRATFFKLLKQGNGRITPLSLAIETNLDGEMARNYLDERAREFSANFEVEADGSLFYQFDTGNMSLPPSPIPVSSEPASSSPTFDVILEYVPVQQKIAAIKIVRELTQMGLKESKELVETAPSKLIERVSESGTHDCKRRFEAIGATIMIVPN